MGWVLAVMLLTRVGWAEERPHVEIGGEAYFDVVLTSKTATHVFFSHSRGIAQVRIEGLDHEALIGLGLRQRERVVRKPPPIVVDPSSEAGSAGFSVWQKLEDLTEREKQILKLLLLSACGFQVMWHFFYGYCCRRVCLRAQLQPGPLVWFPWLSKIPLLRAAGMSPAWILADCFPPLSLFGRIKFARRLSERLRFGTVHTIGLAMCGGYLLPVLAFPLLVISLMEGGYQHLIWLSVAQLNMLSLVWIAFSGPVPNVSSLQQSLPAGGTERRWAT